MIDSINQWGRVWVEYFGIAVLQNTLFLCFMFLTLNILKNVSARIKYTITLIGLIKLFVPPIIPSPFLKTMTTSPTPLTGTTSIESFVEIIPIISPPSESINFMGFLFISWIAVSFCFILIPLMSTIQLKQKLKKSELIHFRYKNKGLTNSVIQIYRNHFISLPLTMSIFSNKIFVPSLWDSWSDDCREMIVQHELSHIKRRDVIVQILQIIMQAIYFFHPLVWLLSSKMNEYREMACDDSAIASQQSSRVEYSKRLIEIAENLVRANLNCVLASSTLIKQKNKLLNRVQYQIKEDKMKTLSRKKIGLVMSLLLAMILPLSWTFSNEQQAKKEKNSAETSVKQDKKFTDIIAFPEPVGGIDTVQKVLVYPEAARKAGLEGEVELKLYLDALGDVTNVEVMNSTFGDNDLGCHQAAIDAIKSVKWMPLKMLDVPGDGFRTIKVIFKLNKPSAALTEKKEIAKGMGKIKGTVKDEKTAQPLVGANITIEGTSLGAASDEAGNYVVPNVPVGKHALKVTMMGYQTLGVRDVNVYKNETLVVNFILKPAIVELKIPDRDELVPPPPPPAAAKEVSIPEAPSISKIENDTTVRFVAYDSPPEPIGGFVAIQRNLIYPESIKKAGVDGMVKLHVQIDEMGNILNVKVMESLNYAGCDEAAINAIKSTKWKPAMQRDIPVKVWVAVPVYFTGAEKKVKK